MVRVTALDIQVSLRNPTAMLEDSMTFVKMLYIHLVLIIIIIFIAFKSKDQNLFQAPLQESEAYSVFYCLAETVMSIL